MLLFKFLKKRKVTIKPIENSQTSSVKSSAMFSTPHVQFQAAGSPTPGSMAQNHHFSTLTPTTHPLAASSINASNAAIVQPSHNIHSPSGSLLQAATPNGMDISQSPRSATLPHTHERGLASEVFMQTGSTAQASQMNLNPVATPSRPLINGPSQISSLPPHIAVPLPDPRLVSPNPIPLATRPNIDKRQIDGFHAARWYIFSLKF